MTHKPNAPADKGCTVPVLEISNSTGIHIFSSDLNGSGTRGDAVYNSDNVSISFCTIHNNSEAGIYLWKSKNIILLKNKIYDNAKSMVILDSTKIYKKDNAITEKK